MTEMIIDIPCRCAESLIRFRKYIVKAVNVRKGQHNNCCTNYPADFSALFAEYGDDKKHDRRNKSDDRRIYAPSVIFSIVECLIAAGISDCSANSK